MVGQKQCFLVITLFEQQIGISEYFDCWASIFAIFRTIKLPRNSPLSKVKSVVGKVMPPPHLQINDYWAFAVNPWSGFGEYIAYATMATRLQPLNRGFLVPSTKKFFFQKWKTHMFISVPHEDSSTRNTCSAVAQHVDWPTEARTHSSKHLFPKPIMSDIVFAIFEMWNMYFFLQLVKY